MENGVYAFDLSVQSDGGLEVSLKKTDTREFSAYRYTLKNTSSAQVSLNWITLSFSSLMGRGFGPGAFNGYTLFRQGRHKNDLPSVCSVGKTDRAFDDCFYGLREDGTGGRGDDAHDEIISDPFVQLCGRGQCALLGFTSETKMLGMCRVGMTPSRDGIASLTLSLAGDGMLIAPGEEIETDELYISVMEDPFEQIERYTRRVREIGAPAPSGKFYKPTIYSTWYYYGDSVSEADVDENLAWLQKRMGQVQVFQVDEGWEWRTGQWSANPRFPSGMGALAEKIRAHGFEPGIWTSPFIIDPRCDIRYYHNEWLLRRRDGKYVTFPMNGMNNLVLDPTHPGVQEWLTQLYGQLRDFGYLYHKFDFTRAVAQDPQSVFFDKRATRAGAYRQGFEVIRRALGKDAYMLVCGGLYLSSYGIANGQRTGSDVKSLWQSEPGEREELPYQIKQNLLRWWMNSLWDNDADSIMVRRQKDMTRALDLSLGLLTDDEARVMAHNQQMAGGIISFTEPMADIEQDRLSLISDVSPSNGFAAVPADLYSARRYPGVFAAKTDDPGRVIITISNWTAQKAAKALPLSLSGYERARVRDHYTHADMGEFACADAPEYELASHSIRAFDVIKTK